MGRFAYNPFNGSILVYRGTGTKQKLPRYHIAKFTESPLAAADDSIRASQALGLAAVVATTGITQPDCARRVLITKSEAAIDGYVVIVGTDIADNAITENVDMEASGTTKVTTKAFKTISSITYPIQTDAGQTIKIGTDACIGLPIYCSVDPILKIRHNITMISAWTLYNSSTDVSKVMVLPTGYVPDGEHLELFLVVAHE